ncbi:MAG: TROVE domain-containing protein [Candidatus Magnetominusculus sp. LBB02]|nr:TROVE domain-containing protein [Candidatus Magnetominusculus sp. LBB02]
MLRKIFKKYLSAKATAQSESAFGAEQVENNAGGYVFALDKWKILDRFLILGTEGGTYYVGESKLTADNAVNLIDCIKEDGLRVVRRIKDISLSGRAPRNSPVLLALAFCVSHAYADRVTVQAALGEVAQICRIGTDLFEFIDYCKNVTGRGWGRAFKRTIQNWYNQKEVSALAYQLLKYQSRNDWSHRDVLRLAKPVPTTDTHNFLYRWSAGKLASGVAEPTILDGYFKIQSASDDKTASRIIRDYGLTHEMIPTEFKKSPLVWDALLEKMPMRAMIRSLGVMSACGLIKPFSDASATVAERLADKRLLVNSRLHPLHILIALHTYNAGAGMKGSLSWDVDTKIVEALDSAFTLSFGNVTPTNKNILIGLDVSGSMAGSMIPNCGNMSARDVGSALCMITARTEANYYVHGFSTTFLDLKITGKQSLTEVIRKVNALPFEATDCAVPMLYALENKLDVDVFIIYTDSETWIGNIHPFQALQQYRLQMNKPAAKLIVVGMTSTGFSIADPTDPNQLDIVGCDANIPQIIYEFTTS